jgi:hypothetical protein
MEFRLLMTRRVQVGDVYRIGAAPHGTRVTAPITSGQFEGPRLRGTVRPGGGDWTLLRGDAVTGRCFAETACSSSTSA